MLDDSHLDLAARVLEACRARDQKLATAESCTGGLIFGALTAVAGSSEVMERGFVTYTNPAKAEMLGVPEDLFESVGAVSEAVARAMAEGALAHSPADLAISVTGVAGPGGGTAEKPVGLVHMALAMRERETVHRKHLFDGDRTTVRSATVTAAMDLILERLQS